ncbi:MAG: multiheme c-type cytochrome, partial [Myxococcota bacterium]
MRNLLFGLFLVGGIALAAGGRKRSGDAPQPVEQPAEEALAEIQERPPAPAMFPDGLPVVIQQVPDGLANLTAQGCNSCHWSAHDQWAPTGHANAWRSERFQAAVARVGQATVCTQCHLPLANQHDRLATGYVDQDLARPVLEDNPAWDPSLMSEGVGCAACHVREGTILAVHDSSRSPHPLAVSAELTRSESCATCHQLSWPGGDRPFYDTYGEWERSRYAEAGVGCQDCHMPPVAAPITASKFAAVSDHGFSADIRRAVSALVDLPSPRVQRGEPISVSVRLQNTGSGHHFPTGSPFKRYRVRARLLDSAGGELAETFTYDLAREIEAEPPWKTTADNRLPAGEEVSLEWEMTVAQKLPAQDATLVIDV